MPNSVSVYRERVLNALEAIQADAEAGGGAATLAALVSIDVALDAIQTSQASIAASDGQGAFSVNYTFPAKDFGAGDWTEDIQGPAGFRGLVKAISIYDVTETFNGSVTESRVEVGIQAGDVDAYSISDDFGLLAADAGLTPALTAGVVGTIPVGEDILVTGYAPDDAGANAGIATVVVTVSYFL